VLFYFYVTSNLSDRSAALTKSIIRGWVAQKIHHPNISAFLP